MPKGLIDETEVAEEVEVKADEDGSADFDKYDGPRDKDDGMPLLNEDGEAVVVDDIQAPDEEDYFVPPSPEKAEEDDSRDDEGDDDSGDDSSVEAPPASPTADDMLRNNALQLGMTEEQIQQHEMQGSLQMAVGGLVENALEKAGFVRRTEAGEQQESQESVPTDADVEFKLNPDDFDPELVDQIKTINDKVNQNNKKFGTVLAEIREEMMAKDLLATEQRLITNISTLEDGLQEKLGKDMSRFEMDMDSQGFKNRIRVLETMDWIEKNDGRTEAGRKKKEPQLFKEAVGMVFKEDVEATDRRETHDKLTRRRSTVVSRPTQKKSTIKLSPEQRAVQNLKAKMSKMGAFDDETPEL